MYINVGFVCIPSMANPASVRMHAATLSSQLFRDVFQSGLHSMWGEFVCYRTFRLPAVFTVVAGRTNKIYCNNDQK